jgi:hypothetical protein
MAHKWKAKKLPYFYGDNRDSSNYHGNLGEWLKEVKEQILEQSLLHKAKHVITKDDKKVAPFGRGHWAKLASRYFKGHAKMWYDDHKESKADDWKVWDTFKGTLKTEFEEEGRAPRHICDITVKKQKKRTLQAYVMSFRSAIQKLKKQGIVFEDKVQMELFKPGMNSRTLASCTVIAATTLEEYVIAAKRQAYDDSSYSDYRQL